jgi:hypothetical protein
VIIRQNKEDHQDAAFFSTAFFHKYAIRKRSTLNWLLPQSPKRKKYKYRLVFITRFIQSANGLEKYLLGLYAF